MSTPGEPRATRDARWFVAPRSPSRERSRGRVSMMPWVAILFTACSGGDGAQRAGPSLDLRVDSMGIVPEARAIRLDARRDLTESSGAAMSAAQPGVWFTINDSGNEPVLYALDTTGADRGSWRITNASNRDWEALTTGPCSHGDSRADAPPTDQCVYIGEVGDNGAKHESVKIYRLAEPRAGRTGFTGEATAVALTVRYESGPRDVEAMFAGPDGSLYLISKRRLKRLDGGLRPALVFMIPADAWLRPDRHVIARLIDSLPIVPGSALGRQITDAAMAPGGAAVAVRTYTQLYVFHADPSSGRIRTDVPPTICSIAGLDERQGEGITWFGHPGRWMLTSEGRGEVAWVVHCGPESR